MASLKARKGMKTSIFTGITGESARGDTRDGSEWHTMSQTVREPLRQE